MGSAVVRSELVCVGGCELEMVVIGEGRPILALHGGNGPFGAASFAKMLGGEYQVIVPSHPGFGRSSRPAHVESIDDVAYVYLELMEKMDLVDVVLIGFSLGGWVAAEIATKCVQRVGRIVLSGAVGVSSRDIGIAELPNIFSLSSEQLEKLAFHDPKRMVAEFISGAEVDENVRARNYGTFSLYAKEPYAYSPKLLPRLHRITVPALFLWGVSDGLVTPEYGRRYSELVPDGEFDLIAEAGHAPHLEQPRLFVERLLRFLC